MNAFPEIAIGDVRTSVVVHPNVTKFSRTVILIISTELPATHAEISLLFEVVPRQIPSYWPLPLRAAWEIV